MSAILSYTIDLGDTDYPGTYNGLLAFLDPYVDEIVAGRQGEASLADNFARYIRAAQGLTQNLNAAGYRITNLPAPAGDADPATKSYADAVKTYADSLAFATALPSQTPAVAGLPVVTDGAAASWGLPFFAHIALQEAGIY